ncbi:MAG: glycosyl transferase [Prevotella sp.]|nr:glycosyl transferase [Prevotella sp.]
MILGDIPSRVVMKMNFLFPDRPYLKLLYFLTMGKRLHLSDPKTMNEKLQWLKLAQRDPLLTSLVDKLTVKEHVAKAIGRKYVCPLLGVWDSFDEIDFDTLPNQFVLKTNHSGGNMGVVICDDKSRFNISEARKKLNSSLSFDIYPGYREWPYKNIRKKIFAEQFLGTDIVDYKFYCFNGDADCVLLCIDRQKGDPKFYFFNKDWQLLRYNKRGKEAPEGFTLPKPDNMDEMFALAARMSKGFPFVRMDFYDVNGKCYFGEYTFYPASGFDFNRLPETDRYFGDKIDLSLV